VTVLALDIGGSSIKYALVRLSRHDAHIVTSFEPIPLVSNKFDDLREQVAACVSAGIGLAPEVRAVAVSTTGSVDQNGTVLNAGHFVGYSNVSWRDILLPRFPQLTKVVTVNDGKASTWAEYIASGRRSGSFVHIVVGTGVGGGIVIDSRLYYGDHLAAGSVGHIKVTAERNVACSCQRYGCVETLAAAPAVVRAFTDRPGTTLGDVVSAARNGDERALSALTEAGRWLGVAIANVMNMVDPAAITIGGGLVLASQDVRAEDGGPYLTAAIATARQMALRRIAEVTDISRAAYGNDGGLIGAALLAAAASN
jgi:glucokinase